MRHNATRTAAALMALWPAWALALTVDGYTGTADCNGWSTELQVTFPANAFMAHLESRTVLTDAAGAEVERFETSGFLQFVPGTTATFPASGQWTTVLDGSYRATAFYYLTDIVADGGSLFADSLVVDFACGVDPGEGGAQEPQACTHPRPYWLRHRQQWPATELALGAVTYGQDALLDILRRPVRGDATLLLARQQIAAKLNLAAGADPSIAPAVQEADDFLTEHPLLSRPRRGAQVEATRLSLRLLAYNFQGCSTQDKGLAVEQAAWVDEDEAELLGLQKEFVEPQSFGSVKSLFR